MNLEYHVPRLGKLNVELFPVAQKAFDLLEHANHIERMKRNHQLGIIRNVYEGAHHSRWEYVMTILHIINHLNKIGSKSFGLSNDTPRIGGSKVSGAEILQVWTLLLNAGHLKGTFASEQALLNVLAEETTLRTTFKNGLPADKEIKKLYKKVIDEGDIYRFHELQSFFFLQRLRRKSATDVELLVKILKLFKFDPTKGKERRRKLKYLYRKIRQISFLFLDSHYGPVPLVFELGPTLFDFDEHSKSIFSLEESHLSNNLKLFEDLMSESFYLAPNCMYAFGKQSRVIKEKIERLPQSSKTSILKLYDFLKKGHELDPKYWIKDPDFLLRFWFDESRSPMSVLKRIKSTEVESRITSKLAKTYCDVSALHDPTKRMLGITLAFSESIPHESLVRLLSQIMQQLIAFQDYYKRKALIKSRDPFRKIFQQSCKQLSLFILKKLWGKNLLFIPVDHTIHQDHWAIERGSTSSANWLKEQVTWHEKRELEADRLHEMKTLARALEKVEHRGTVLFTTSQIIVRKISDGSDITDLDGLAICSTSNNLSLLLVEAKKRKKKGASEAKKRIRKILNAMELTEVEDNDITVIPKYGASIKISL